MKLNQILFNNYYKYLISLLLIILIITPLFLSKDVPVPNETHYFVSNLPNGDKTIDLIYGILRSPMYILYDTIINNIYLFIT